MLTSPNLFDVSELLFTSSVNQEVIDVDAIVRHIFISATLANMNDVDVLIRDGDLSNRIIMPFGEIDNVRYFGPINAFFPGGINVSISSDPTAISGNFLRVTLWWERFR